MGKVLIFIAMGIFMAHGALEEERHGHHHRHMRHLHAQLRAHIRKMHALQATHNKFVYYSRRMKAFRGQLGAYNRRFKAALNSMRGASKVTSKMVRAARANAALARKLGKKRAAFYRSYKAARARCAAASRRMARAAKVRFARQKAYQRAVHLFHVRAAQRRNAYKYFHSLIHHRNVWAHRYNAARRG